MPFIAATPSGSWRDIQGNLKWRLPVNQSSSAAPRFTLPTLGFVAFVTSFGAHVVAVNLPVYAKQVGIGVAMIGILIAVYDFAEIFAKPISGWIADRKGVKATMLAGIAFFSLASLAYLFVSPRLLILIRFLQGLGAAALSITSAALVAEYFPSSRGRAFGLYNALKGAGYVISPVVGGAIVWKTNFSIIFLASFAAGALAFALSLRLCRPSGRPGLEEDHDLSLKQFLGVFRQRTLLPWYLIIVINMFMLGILFGFAPVYIYFLGYSQLANGMIIGAGTACYLLIQPLAGHLSDKVHPLPTVLAGLLLSAVGLLLIPFTSGPGLILLVMAAGTGVGTVWTNTDAMVSNLAQQGQMALALGAAGSFKELGDMLGPLLIGVLSQAFGLKAGFITCGILGLCAIPVLWVASDVDSR